jgi:chromosome partitioning protein
MALTITISNHKGGVGKTTSTLNIGAGLNQLGKKVLLIDLDPQANLTTSTGVQQGSETIYDYLLKRVNDIQPITIMNGLNIIPSTLDLSAAEIELSAETGREYILREVISPLQTKYDYILIDSAPSLGLLTINALTASDQVFIPIQAQYLAMKGLTKLMDVIKKIQSRLNKNLVVGGVFVTQYDKRKTLNRDVLSSIQSHFGELVFKTLIRDNVALAEAPTAGLDIFRYQPLSYGAEDYLSLCKEILNHLNKNGS